MHGFGDNDDDALGNMPSYESFGWPANERANDIRDDRWACIPDVRDGLTRAQRIVLYEIHKAQKETGREFVPTVMLYGRVVEHINISEAELHAILQSLGVTG